MARINTSTAEQVLQLASEPLSEQTTPSMTLVHIASPLFSGSDVVGEQLRELPLDLDLFIDFREFQLDTDNPSVIRTFAIEQLPTLLIFRNGEVVERIESVLQTEALESLLRDVISFYVPAEGDGPNGPTREGDLEGN